MSAEAPRPGVQTATLEVFRDITRGGLAGLIVGVLLAGIGGRLVMRLAALLVPSADGALTENGNRIGDINLGGSLTIIIGIGLLFGAIAGSLWVVIRPWLPRSRLVATIATIPIAVALGTRGLVEARNEDFEVLGHDPLVVASLVILVAAFGPALVVVDAWLERRLPHPGPADRKVIGGFAIVTFLGLILTTLIVVPLYLGSPLRLAGVALVVVGLATLATWVLRSRVQREAPRWLTLVGRVGVGAAVVAGLAVVIPEIQGALG
ncbi:MAG: hypothetical protein ACSLFN_10950 [Candidatus Limnocylindrales bacterium]